MEKVWSKDLQLQIVEWKILNGTPWLVMYTFDVWNLSTCTQQPELKSDSMECWKIWLSSVNLAARGKKHPASPISNQLETFGTSTFVMFILY